MVFFVYAFTGPGSNNPPYGSPVFWLLSGTNMYYNAGNVGIGTSTPTAGKLVVNGTIDVSNNKITSIASPTASTDAATKVASTPKIRHTVSLMII